MIPAAARLRLQQRRVHAVGREPPMQSSIFLAQLLGPCFLVMGVGLMLNADGYRAMAREFLKSRPLIYLAGLLAIAPGLAVVLVHNVWTADWRVIISVSRVKMRGRLFGSGTWW